MDFGKNIRKFRKQTRAISPVIATLLMIAIAVVASLVTYAWVMGYMNFQQEKTGNAIQIQSMTSTIIYVQNVGDSAVSIDDANAVFIDGSAVASYSLGAGFTSGSIPKGETGTITITGVTIDAGETVKVITTDGTFSQVVKAAQ